MTDSDMFWKKIVKFDRTKAYLDKSGIDDTVDRMMEECDDREMREVYRRYMKERSSEK